MYQFTKIALAVELSQQNIPRLHIAKQNGIGRATLYRWLKGIERAGNLEGFLDQYLSSKKGERAKRKVDGLLKLRFGIYEINMIVAVKRYNIFWKKTTELIWE